MNINIRPATAPDLNAIANIFLVSVRTICSQDYTHEQIEAIIIQFNEQLHLLAIEIEAGTVFVAEAKSLVGFASLSQNGKAINYIFVHPEYIRQGIGTLLLSAIEEVAVQKQVSRLWVMSSLTGRAFYSACGYEYIQDSALIDAKTGIRVPCIDLVKVLNCDRNYLNASWRNLSTLTMSQFLYLAGRILLGN